MSSGKRRVVLASNNAKKAAELEALLAPLGWEVLAQGALGITEAEEPHPTFLENALAKARHAAAASGLPAIADDSGLAVPALGGAPGVRSARFAGEPRSDARNNVALLAAMQGLEGAARRAFFYGCVVFLRSAEDPLPLVAEGRWWGEILTEPRGERGFGYDPLFYLPALGKTAAELSPEEKNRLSHRGRALRRLRARLAREEA